MCHCLAGSNITMAHRYSCWARSQMKYILGDCGRSYVVGFGNSPPTHVHHRGASCPLETGGLGSNAPTCDFPNFNLATSNPNILYGALVGGASLPATKILALLTHLSYP